MATPTRGPASRRWPTWLMVVFGGVLIGWLAWSLFTPAARYEKQLPDLTLERIGDGELNLRSLRGAPVVVNLWATWCLPCLRELPMLAEAARRNPEVSFVFADQGEAREPVERYLSERPELRLENVVLDREVALGVEFETLGLPMTLFFDPEGNHLHSHIGEVTESEMAAYLDQLKRGELNPL